MEKQRCPWCLKDDLYMKYHDEIWGVPEYDNIRLFEFLNLEGAQAGLSWYTVLTKKENYYECFKGWNPDAILNMAEKEKAALFDNPGIIRNKLKINAVFTNAEAYVNMRDQGIEFSDYLWSFVDHKPILNNYKSHSEIPSQTDISQTMSKSLKKSGFKFVGPTITYAFMQAVGMVNDHIINCWRYKEA